MSAKTISIEAPDWWLNVSHLWRTLTSTLHSDLKGWTSLKLLILIIEAISVFPSRKLFRGCSIRGKPRVAIYNRRGQRVCRARIFGVECLEYLIWFYRWMNKEYYPRKMEYWLLWINKKVNVYPVKIGNLIVFQQIDYVL